MGGFLQLVDLKGPVSVARVRVGVAERGTATSEEREPRAHVLCSQADDGGVSGFTRFPPCDYRPCKANSEGAAYLIHVPIP